MWGTLPVFSGSILQVSDDMFYTQSIDNVHEGLPRLFSLLSIFAFIFIETFIDVSDAAAAAASGSSKESHWISESGNIDFFLFPGPMPSDVFAQFTAITGRQQLPPLFALGYHQCRWNYRDEKDVAAVEGMFEELDFPMVRVSLS